MKFENFIAKRLVTAKNNKSSISAPIIKIAIWAISIGMIMMIVSIATGMGLQKTIRQKISAFNGHIIISSYTNNNSDVSLEPISTHQNFYPNFTKVDKIDHVQAVISKAGIIRTATNFEGIIYKGVGKDFDWKYMKEYLISGRIPNLNSELNSEVIISQFLANRLHLKINDNFNYAFQKR